MCIIHQLQRLLVFIDGMDLSLSLTLHLLLELNPRALLSLLTRQNLMKFLNIYVLKVVYLPLCAVLDCILFEHSPFSAFTPSLIKVGELKKVKTLLFAARIITFAI